MTRCATSARKNCHVRSRSVTTNSFSSRALYNALRESVHILARARENKRENNLARRITCCFRAVCRNFEYVRSLIIVRRRFCSVARRRMSTFEREYHHVRIAILRLLLFFYFCVCFLFSRFSLFSSQRRLGNTGWVWHETYTLLHIPQKPTSYTHTTTGRLTSALRHPGCPLGVFSSFSNPLRRRCK